MLLHLSYLIVIQTEKQMWWMVLWFAKPKRTQRVKSEHCHIFCTVFESKWSKLFFSHNLCICVWSMNYVTSFKDVCEWYLWTFNLNAVFISIRSTTELKLNISNWNAVSYWAKCICCICLQVILVDRYVYLRSIFYFCMVKLPLIYQ